MFRNLFVMFHNLFTARSSHPLESHPSSRPQLEALEDRVTPAGMFDMPGGAMPSTGFTYGPASSIVDNSGIVTSAANSVLTFGFSPESYALAVLGAGLPVGLYPYAVSQNVSQIGTINGNSPLSTGGGGAGSLGQIGNVLGSLLQITAMESSPQQAFNLAVDEFFQASDTFALLRSQALGITNANTASVQNFLSGHEQAIAQNPADHTPAGQFLGTLVYDATIFLLASQSGGV